MIQHGFGTLGMATIRASTDAAHVASVRVLQKLGFRLARRATAAGLDTLFYELERSNTMSNQPPQPTSKSGTLG